jgi:diaminopimelate decarboxylase
MHRFEYHDGHLWCEATPLLDVASQHGTPLYVYSTDTLRQHYLRLNAAFAPAAPLVCFSVKSCPNIQILALLREWGSGFDVVSGGELHRARLAGAAADKIVFAGVGKTEAELRAALQGGVGMINVESGSELALLARVASELEIECDVAIRVIPEIDARTHAYTTTGTRRNKFGVPLDAARSLFAEYAKADWLRLAGVHVHIGSPVRNPESYVGSVGRALELIDELARDGVRIETFDVGGGFAAEYAGDESPGFEAYADAILPLLAGRDLRIVLEPGRSLAATAGVLLTRVLHVKETGEKRFVVVDAAMTDLLRPALYDAYHFIWPVEAAGRVPQSWQPAQPFDGLLPCDVVGPVCESGDFLARDRLLPPVRSGDLLAVFSCGAYAMSMASQYNSRPRAAEILVDDRAVRLIRRRETFDDLVAAERVDSP